MGSCSSVQTAQHGNGRIPIVVVDETEESHRYVSCYSLAQEQLSKVLIHAPYMHCEEQVISFLSRRTWISLVVRSNASLCIPQTCPQASRVIHVLTCASQG